VDGARSRPLWPSLIVLVGTVAVVAVVLIAVADRTADPLAEVGGDVTTQASPTAAPPTPAEPTPAEPTPAEPTPGPSSAPPSPPATVDGDPGATADPTSPVPDVTVDVLNETQVAGLAGRAAEVLVETGWQVGLVDNSALAAPSTTVYVPAGLEAEADALTRAFPALTRTRPTFEGLDPSRLTIVLAQPDAEFVVAAMEATTRSATGGLASASRSGLAAGDLASR
jgi:hypothetical protein